MFKILIVDEDVVSNRKIEEILKNKPECAITFASSVEKAKELIAPNFNKEKSPPAGAAPKSPAAAPQDATAAKDSAAPAIQEKVVEVPPLGPALIFVDVSKIKGDVLQWHTDLREVLKAGGNENVPLILLSLSSDPIFIRGFLGPGVHDVFVKPVITTTLETALNHFTDSKNQQPRKMTPIKGVVEMYYQALAKEISEFEMKIVTSKQISLNDFKPIYGDFFKWSPERRVIGRCTDCVEDEEIEGSYIETFTFVGVPPAITKEIRVWLKSQYINQKQSAKQG